MPNAVIIGAGLAGLLAGRTLTRAGWEVALLDKGRGVGGRLATRRINDATFDHGAQFFTVRDPRFQAIADEWLAAGVAVEWTRGFATNDGHPRYRGVPGMTALAKHLAAGLNINLGERATAVRVENNHWQIQMENGATFTADALVMTPPVPQSLALLDAGNFTLPADSRAALDKIAYHPCIALMAVLDQPSAIPAPGGVQINTEPILWIGDNAQKGVSPVSALTIHAAPEFSRTHWDTPHDEIARLLLAAAQPYIGDAPITTFQVHKWRYSQPTVLHEAAFLGIPTPPPLVFAGDAFATPRVEGAALSGLAAADWLQSL